MTDLDNMPLPQVNERRQESTIQQRKLRIMIEESIEKYQIDNSYRFEKYEIDNVLLEIVKRRHESYIRVKFGNETL